MSKFTAAPWRAASMSRNGYLESAKHIFAGDVQICQIEYELMDTGSNGIKNADANAALIAAAPELYAALEKCLSVLSDLPSTNNLGTRTREAYDTARAILAKARI